MQYVLERAVLAEGEHTVAVEYPGTAEIAAASFSTSFIVKPAKSSVFVEIDPSGLGLGDPFTVTTTVNRSSLGSLLARATLPADGDIELFVDGISSGTVTLVDGQAEADLPGLSGGAHVVTVRYLGNQNHEPSEAQVDVQVTLAATTVSLQAATDTLEEGATTVLTATVDGLLDGFHSTATVQFLVDGKNFAAPVALANGSANLTLNGLKPGVHKVTAVFHGDGNYEASASDPIKVTVTPAPGPKDPGGSGNGDGSGSGPGNGNGPGDGSGSGPGNGNGPGDGSGSGENTPAGGGSASGNTGQGHLAQTGGAAHEAWLLAVMMLLTGASLLVVRRSSRLTHRRR